jgi:acetyl esterase
MSDPHEAICAGCLNQYIHVTGYYKSFEEAVLLGLCSRFRVYLEKGKPVIVLKWWRGKGPRNVLVQRQDGSRVVRPFRGLRNIHKEINLGGNCNEHQGTDNL